MNIMVLDDEPIIRQGIIHKITQTGLPVTVIAEAGDGVQGLQLMKSVKPDLILTDIHMPGIDGLEFIRQARLLDSEVQVVIITGFDNFDYAKQAIKYGVANYMVKPLEEEELYATLSSLLERKEAEHQTVQMIQELRSVAETSQEAFRQQALTQFLQEEDFVAATAELEELARHGAYFTAVVIQLESFKVPHQSFGSQEESLLWFAIKNIVTERFLSNSIQGILVHHSLRRFELVYVLGLRKGQDKAGVTSALESISFGIRKYLRLEATIGVGPYQEQITRVQESYREAKQIARNSILHGSSRIYQTPTITSTGKEAQRKSFISQEDIRLLEDWLGKWERDKIHKWIERRLGAIVQEPSSSYVMVEWFCVDLYLFLNKYWLVHADNSKWAIGELTDLQRELEQTTAWQDIVDMMNKLVTNMIGLLSHTSNLDGKEIMEAVRVYLEQHYAEPIQLSVIAERFFIHPNYFSKRFKEKYGESFVDYLNGLRMKEAARLLVETDLKIREISERVGFEDAAYFGSVFRKRFKMTPGQYREQSSDQT
ncbi:response regulator [Paenibacillus sp. F411]|uniref:response regulator n=1 Tax=Paenibacillus sp. F411 TaxID=2820239 RepID=UPI001AAFC6BF|nr:response regulator [Paenibacillus sp. F411]MBO2942379.1 response regulator [Paenibacillus sp. F411]